jgi:hypothetical protein
MEYHLADIVDYIEHSDPIELDIHTEQDKEFHLEILEVLIDESVSDQEETKEIEFEFFEYPDNSNPHPPPKVPISSKEIFDNLDEKSEATSLTVPLPTSQPSDDLIQDNGKMEYNLNLSTLDHYEQWLAFHDDNHIKKFIKFCKIFQTLKFG